MEQNNSVPRTVKTATMTLLRKNVWKFSRPNHVAKFSNVKVSGHHVGGRLSSSDWGFAEPRYIQTNGMSVATTAMTSTMYTRARPGMMGFLMALPWGGRLGTARC